MDSIFSKKVTLGLTSTDQHYKINLVGAIICHPNWFIPWCKPKRYKTDHQQSLLHTNLTTYHLNHFQSLTLTILTTYNIDHLQSLPLTKWTTYNLHHWPVGDHKPWPWCEGCQGAPGSTDLCAGGGSSIKWHEASCSSSNIWQPPPQPLFPFVRTWLEQNTPFQPTHRLELYN